MARLVKKKPQPPEPNPEPPKKPTDPPANVSERDAFVMCANSEVGSRYVWGTAGPDTFDCSGLVAYCYKRATGKDITRSSYDQIKLGKPVTIDKL
ncbi:MAG TPA: NlpC/P60 family protein, partial [Nitrospira sp.]|nr:NlpC/P60 family protein [Nitrospira sp.]